MTEPSLRDRITRHFGIDRKIALRVCHWLDALANRNLIHPGCGIVRAGQRGIGSFVAVVDWRAHSIGCALCGEWAADAGTPLDPDFKLVVLAEDFLPRELHPLNLSPAVLYCVPCFSTYKLYLGRRLGVPEEVLLSENSGVATATPVPPAPPADATPREPGSESRDAPGGG